MSAVISECNQYRYRLDRQVQDDGLVIAYFGINPSTADAYIDDQTVKKWKGFTQRMGGSRFIVGNVFAYRSTDVKALSLCEDPVGVRNAYYLYDMMSEADILIPCWGNRHKVPEVLRQYVQQLEDVLLNSGKPVKTFGFTKSGDPKHPMMLGYDTEIVDWVIT